MQATLRVLLLLSCVGLLFANHLEGDNVAIKWLQTEIELIKMSIPLPVKFNLYPAIRSEALLATSMYDAWAVYDNVAEPYIASDVRKSEVKPRYFPDLKKAISYAAYRVLSEVYGSLAPQYGGPVYQQKLDAFFASLGYDKTITARSLENEAEVGNLVAAAIIANRTDDGYNAYGTHPNSNGVPYSDITNFTPVNDPFPEIARTDCSPSKLRDINHWQPARFRTPAGSAVQTIGESNPAMAVPFALSAPAELRPAPPPLYGKREPSATLFNSNVEDMLNVYSQLGDVDKVKAQFWQLGINGSTAPGFHFMMAINAARATDMSLGETVKFLFGHAWAMWDAFIAYNDGKLFYDPPRPTTILQCVKANQMITSWRGPYLGVGQMNGSHWSAYLKDNFVTNNSPEYPCGHCTASASVFEYYRNYFGSDIFRGQNSWTFPAGSSPIEPKIVEGQAGYVAGLTDVPNSGPGTPGYAPAQAVTLYWPTWSAAEYEVSRSRILLGVHFEYSRVVSVELGHQVGRKVYQKASQLWNGTKIMCITHQ